MIKDKIILLLEKFLFFICIVDLGIEYNCSKVRKWVYMLY